MTEARVARATIAHLPQLVILSMANLGSLLKSEITRLARKEVKAQTEALRKASAGYRHEIAAMKRQVSDLQRQLAAVERGARRTQPAAAPQGEGSEPLKGRFTVGGLKTHRAKLGLSATDYGRLVGVSGQSIYNYESGKAVPRAPQVQAMLALRALGKRAALAKLEE